MPLLVALIRAVNVGGHGRLPMDRLRALAAGAGLEAAETLLASGNLIFESTATPEAAGAALEQALLRETGQATGVIVRTGADILAALAGNPFPQAPGDRVAVLFAPQGRPADPAEGLRGQADEQVAGGDAGLLYIHYPSGMGRSRLRLAAMEHGTARNLKSLQKLADRIRARTGG